MGPWNYPSLVCHAGCGEREHRDCVAFASIIQRKLPAVRLSDGRTDRQSKTQAMRLRRTEWVEQLVLDLWLDPKPAISDEHLDVSSLPRLR
jgi:hypothetical protein